MKKKDEQTISVVASIIFQLMTISGQIGRCRIHVRWEKQLRWGRDKIQLEMVAALPHIASVWAGSAADAALIFRLLWWVEG